MIEMLSSQKHSGTKFRIIQAAEGIIVESGFQGCTIDKVIVESGISRGTVFKYVENKGKLFEFVVDLAINGLEDRILHLIRTLTVTSSNSREVLFNFLTVIADESAADIWTKARVVSASVLELRHSHPELVARVHGRLKVLMASAASFFNEAGLAPNLAERYAKQLVSILLGAVALVKELNGSSIPTGQILLFRDQLSSEFEDPRTGRPR